MSLFTSSTSTLPLAEKCMLVLPYHTQFPPLAPWWKSQLGQSQACPKEVDKNDELEEVEIGGKRNKKLTRAKLQEYKPETMGNKLNLEMEHYTKKSWVDND